MGGGIWRPARDAPFPATSLGFLDSRAGVLVPHLFHESCIWNSLCLCFCSGNERLRSGGRACVPPDPRSARTHLLEHLSGHPGVDVPQAGCPHKNFHPLWAAKTVTKPNAGPLTPRQQSQPTDLGRGEGKGSVIAGTEPGGQAAHTQKNSSPLTAFGERFLRTVREGGG